MTSNAPTGIIASLEQQNLVYHPPSSSSANAGDRSDTRASEAKWEQKYRELEEERGIERDYYAGELILERNRAHTELKDVNNKFMLAKTEIVKLKEEIKGLKAEKKA